MTLAQIVATTTGAILIGAIQWWFFLAGRRDNGVKAETRDGIQEVTITVAGGYAPDPVVVEAGRPVRLNFHRTDTDPCSEEVVLGDFSIRRFLSTDEVTPVEFTPEHPGRFVYTCGMGMFRGTIEVVPAQPAGPSERSA